ncbi:HD domain-containing protein [Salmonella enterica]
MDIGKIKGCLAFLQEAEKLKSVLRSAHSSTGRAESTAEHSWRLCLMAMIFVNIFITSSSQLAKKTSGPS